MARHKDGDWNLPIGLKHGGDSLEWHHARTAVLMDIRDELKTLNAVFRCHNALAIPALLRDIKTQTFQIAENTKPKPRRRRASK